MGPAGAWPWIRALLIGLVLLVHGTKALPWPDLRQSDLRYGVAQDELDRWAGVLSELGQPITPDALAQRVLAVGRVSIAVQNTLHGPFRPLLRLTGTGQAWGLFAYPDPYPGRLVVSVVRDSDTGRTPQQDVYRAPGSGTPWLVDLLEYRRVRGIYDDNGDRPRPGIFYNRFCSWLSAEIMDREPDVTQVMVHFDRVTVRVPGDGRPPEPDRRQHLRTRDRQDVARLLELRGVTVQAGPPTPVQATPPVGP